MISLRSLRALVFAAPLCLVAVPSFADDSFKEVQSRISEFTLNNGWKFIVLERHQAPVAAFYTYADVGSVQERPGITGLAHMFEHMAFKGSSRVGTKNYAEEKLSLDRVDQTFRAFQLERDKGAKADPEKLKKLEADFKSAQETADQFIVPNEFGRAISEAGGRGLNASTSWDKTDYFFSAPSNSMELWFYLESERFRDPVFREFYKERSVVAEERRMRTESNPIGKLVEEFLAVAYKAHPYGQPVVGHMSDLDNFTRQDAIEFAKKYYQPSNLTSVVVGDVDPKDVRRLADAYFAPIASGPKPDPLRTTEPPQEFERRVTLKLNAQRLVLLGYHKPDINDPDNAVYDALGSVLSEGRSSRLNRSLVQDKKLAVNAFGQPGFPGQKYPNLFLFGAFVAPGKTNDEVEKAMLTQIDRLKTELVTADELEGIKNRARAGLIHNFNENSQMAQDLAQWQVLTGDWRNLFRYLDKLNAVTAQDIQRVAKKTFTEGNRSVGVIEPLEQQAAAK
jgi:predicted Zn-dependent peptidase